MLRRLQEFDIEILDLKNEEIQRRFLCLIKTNGNHSDPDNSGLCIYCAKVLY